MVETWQTVIQLLLSCCGSRSAKMSLQIYGKRVEVGARLMIVQSTSACITS